MNKKFYGLVEAIINDDERQVQLSYRAPGKQPLDESTRLKCLDWALSALADLKAQGYIFELPGAAQN